tara:strand:- start:15 stop:419 length:405 start_codon:yes stop_codon:yes gene_type:complete
MKQNQITALKKIIKEMVSKEVAKQMQIVISEITNPPVQNTVDEIVSSPEKKPAINVKDPVLNKILNETEGGIQGGQEAYPTMGGGAYTSDRMTEVAGVTPTGQPTGNMPDFMKKAMSGHSAKVVKAIEKKHGSR